MNDTIAALLWTTLGGVITQVVGSILKRGENKTTDEIAKDKMEYEQAMQMRTELRHEIKELRDLLTASDKERQDLARKVAIVEADNAKKDAQIVMLEIKVRILQEELDKFNHKVYYVRKEEDNDSR